MTTNIENEHNQPQANAQEAEVPDIQETTAETPETEAQAPAAGQDTDPLAALEAEKAQINDRLMRLMAEFDNYRKRTAKEKENTFGDAKALVFTELLPVIDNFERALQSESSDENFKKGVEMIYTSFIQLLEKNTVESFGKAGDSFDPNLHHAVMHIEQEGLPENSISEVFQKGYRMGDRVLRCAMVQTAN